MTTKPDIVDLLDSLANSDGVSTDVANALAAAADEIRGLREEIRHLEGVLSRGAEGRW